ncbi:MAG TPA: sigma-E factor negative regulatory protein, partial [Pseudomonadales bacterium]|nr:sigma-E factor negative regulatory protein [Pseudomonadales bacterium]
MSDKSHHMVQDEALSALMDGEVQELELRRLLQCLPDDPAVRARWARYQMVSSILHKQPCLPVVSLGFADAVRAAIEKEQVFELHSHTRKNLGFVSGGWRKSAVRFAVAASVAMVVVTGVQWQQRMSATEQLANVVPATTNA